MNSLVENKVVTETRMLMGTVINIKAVGPDLKTASAAINACFGLMSSLEGVLSRFQPESQLSRLNQSGVLQDAHPALLAVLRQSQELSQLTGGAFDVTVNPLLSLYQSSDGLPDEKLIQAVLSLVDYRKLRVEGTVVYLELPGMSITLDGIAKGFIVDEGAAILRESGFANVIVEAGGDLMVLGEKDINTSWRIGVQAPRAETGHLTATFNVTNQAVATSGDYLQAFTPDFAHHHIIDPRTGISSPELASVSVVAPSVALADGLATAVMVMGKAGLDLIENLSGCEAYAITKNVVVQKTVGF
jgi:thiamine biosynthesis lipoprotein